MLKLTFFETLLNEFLEEEELVEYEGAGLRRREYSVLALLWLLLYGSCTFE
jgi:hypothetical protein